MIHFLLNICSGIGAYLVRLGQRVVQVDSSSIILTGKLLVVDAKSSTADIIGAD